ncbi:MAG: hypothetical protein KBF68_08925 [Nitrosomonas sp.]|nr:hypothetical protein [Nitrosomonas sp.]
MSSQYEQMAGWLETKSKLIKEGDELMNANRGEVNHLEVANAVTQFLTEKYGKDIDHPLVLEGLFLSMQMVGGPVAAARTISYCVPKVS